MQLMPDNNILFGFAGGALATVAMHYAKVIGYDVPPDIASGLPVSFALVLAHIYDCITGDNKPKA